MRHVRCYYAASEINNLRILSTIVQYTRASYALMPIPFPKMKNSSATNSLTSGGDIPPAPEKLFSPLLSLSALVRRGERAISLFFPLSFLPFVFSLFHSNDETREKGRRRERRERRGRVGVPSTRKLVPLYWKSPISFFSAFSSSSSSFPSAGSLEGKLCIRRHRGVGRGGGGKGG